MEILPFEEVERVAGAKMQKGGVTCLQQYGYYNSSTPVHGFLEDSSDEDDYMAALLPKSEEGSACCVCGENVPLLNKLIDHFKTHTNEVCCHLCQTKFGRVMSLALHLKNAHPSQSFMCGICRTLFRCSWHLNGHMEKHQKGAMQVKPVGKMEPTEVSIKENTIYTEMRKQDLWDHSYCVPDQAATNETCRNHIENDTDSTNQVSHIKTETERLPIIDKQNDTCSLSQSKQEHVSYTMKEENEDENGLGESIVYEVAAEKEIGLTEDDLSTNTDDDVNPDSLPPGDTAYNPDEDFSSEPDSDSRSSSYERHRKKKRRKTQTPNSKKPVDRNLESAVIAEKFGFQSDSPFCCYGKFANLGKHMDDCRNKPKSACRLCNTVCENEKMLLKHMTEKHPAGYICSRCHCVFPRLDHFKNHVCLRRTTGGTNLPATLVTQIPAVPLSNSSGQLRPSAPALPTNPNSSEVIKMTQTVNKVSTAAVPSPLMLQPLLHTTPLVPAKGYYNSSTPVHGFLEDSTDEDDYMAALLPKSEEGSACCVCGENVPLLNKLIDHFKTHTNEVCCHLCQTKFGRVMSLALHLKNAHPSQSFMCGICRTLFRCSWHLNGHMEKHQKGAMQVKPVGKMEPTEVSIKENTIYTEMRKQDLWDHSYCVPDQAATNETCRNHIENDTDSTNQVSHIKTETERLPIIDKQNDTCSLSQSKQEHVSYTMKEENEDENGLGESIVYEVAAEKEIGLTEDDLSTNTDDDVNPDSLPPGDTAYNPDEDFSSEPDSDSRSSSYERHRKKKRRKTQTPNSKKPVDRNLESAVIADKFGFQSDSPFCCYGKFANLGKHMDDCRNKPKSACRLCNTVCENEKMLLKHMTEKHPAGYICSRCHCVFPRLDRFKNHVCLRRTTGGTNLPATLVTQIPAVPLSNSSGQLRPSAPALPTNANSSEVIKITQTVNKVSTAAVPSPLMLQPLLHTTPLVPAKVTNLVPQVMAVPQTLIRPHFPQISSVARPKVPVHIPPVVCPLIPNLARMTLRIPTPSNTPFPSQVIVSFSPTVNVSAPCLVSTSRPVLRQTPLANIRPIPVNGPQMASVTCPTLVSALTENKPQVPPAQAQAPLQIVGMFVNRNATEVIQKRLEQSWRSKTIFPCRHCGAVSRQPSLKVRHRYLHRGSRLYRCQCGRSFQRQLHLLRHQVQHAESVRFVCASCGNTFEGAHKLTWHKQKRRNGRRCVKKKCKAAFECSSCGQMFTRPSALLWHMLKNSKLTKHTRKNSQPVSA